jgi:hypothetical protein
MRIHRASAATPPKGPDAAPEAGRICAVESLRSFADAKASPFEARLITTQIHPVKLIGFGRIVL